MDCTPQSSFSLLVSALSSDIDCIARRDQMLLTVSHRDFGVEHKKRFVFDSTERCFF